MSYYAVAHAGARPFEACGPWPDRLGVSACVLLVESWFPAVMQTVEGEPPQGVPVVDPEAFLRRFRAVIDDKQLDGALTPERGLDMVTVH